MAKLNEQQRTDLLERAARPAMNRREEEQRLLDFMRFLIEVSPDSAERQATNCARHLTRDGFEADIDTKAFWALHFHDAANDDQFAWDVSMEIVNELRKRDEAHALWQPPLFDLLLDLLPRARPGKRGRSSFAERDRLICGTIQLILDIGLRPATSEKKRSACHLVAEAVPGIGYSRVVQIWKKHRTRQRRFEARDPDTRIPTRD